MGRHKLDLSGSGDGHLMCDCKFGNQPSRSIKWWKFID